MNLRSIDSEYWGIWVSPLKTRQIRLWWCRKPEGLIERIKLRFSGLNIHHEEWPTIILGLFGLMVVHSAAVKESMKRKRLTALCVFE